MSKKKFISQYTAQQIENILKKADEEPLVLYYDKSNKLYRGFADIDKQNLWLSDPTFYADLELFNFIAPAPYTINVTGLTDNVYLLQGESSSLNYTFNTADGNGTVINESVVVTYTFTNEGNTTVDSRIYAAGTEVSYSLDKYLKAGTNSITINLKGRTTGTTNTIILTYNVIELVLTSNFNVNTVFTPNQDIDITYSVSGIYDKHILAYIDGVQVGSATVTSLYPTATRPLSLSNTYSSGKHTLQLRATMDVNNTTFSTKTLFYEFVITGNETNEVTIEQEYPNNVILINQNAYITAEEYTAKEITFGVYNYNPSLLHTTVYWYLSKDDVDTLIKSVVITNDNTTTLEPLKFVPEVNGEYSLKAVIDGVTVAEYDIQINTNSNGIEETTNGLKLKLSALGKSNTDAGYNEWKYGNITTSFNNVEWNTASGWNDDALYLNGGATAEIDYTPLNDSPTTKGATIEIEFETYNVEDDNAAICTVDNGIGGKINITATQATLTSALGTKLMTKYKNNERIKLAFVINPNDSFLTERIRVSSIINNGILERATVYANNDVYDSTAKIKLGNADSKAGVKIYNIRCYNVAITDDDEFNNYIIDAPDTETLIDDNDIYADGTLDISVDKMQQKIDVILIDGDVSILSASKNKVSIVGNLQRICPSDSSKNFIIENATIRNHGQSTLGMPVPSMKIWSDKNGSVLYDDENNAVTGGRYAFKNGAMPTKKWILQANYMDSSGTHNGAIERLFTDTWYKAAVNGDYVLRTPPQEVQAKWNDLYNTTFPYQIRISPDSLPCVVFWRSGKDDTESYQFLGQYVFMEDKKSDYLYGERSIYSNPTDPFCFYSDKKNYERVWDNSNAMQIEILRNSHELTMFMDNSKFWNPTDSSDTDYEFEQAFEFIYPDPEDLTENEYLEKVNIFKANFVDKLCATYQNQTKFNNECEQFLDLYKLAAYYIFMLRFGLVDNSVRNAQIKTYDGVTYWLEPWDIDIALGLRNDGHLVFDPCIDRDSKDPDNSSAWAFAGRSHSLKEDNEEDSTSTENEFSSWLWDALEANPKFNMIVPKVAQALYNAGLTYNNLIEMFDGEYGDKWCARIYNNNGKTKYIDQYTKGSSEGYLSYLQGKRESHRHWWLKTSMDYWDAKWAVGDFTATAIYFRSTGAPKGTKMYFAAAKNTYFGWGMTSTLMESGVKVSKGGSFTFTYTQNGNTNINDPFLIYSPISIASIDFNEFAPYTIGSIQFDACYDSVLGTNLKSLILGITQENLKKGILNNVSESNITISGFKNLTNLTDLQVQGYVNVGNFDFSGMTSLKNLYAGYTNIKSFNPADGCTFSKLYLNNTIERIQMKDVSWEDIKFMDTTDCEYKDNIPTSINYIKLTNMGSNLNAKTFVWNWLKTITDYNSVYIEMNDISWEDVPYSDLEVLAKIPKENRVLNGYILIDKSSLTDGELTSNQTLFLTTEFGDDIFNSEGKLVIDTERGFVISSKGDTYLDEDNNVCIIEGNSTQLSAVQFPIKKRDEDIEWSLKETSWDGFSSTVDYQSVSLNRKTGYLTTKESTFDDYTVNIIVLDNVSMSNGLIELHVKKKSYPTSITITSDGMNDSNQVFINDTGRKIFTVVPNKAYTGSISSYKWTFNDDEQSYIDTEYTNENQCCIKVDSLKSNEVIDKSLGVTITYANGTTLTYSVNVSMVALIPILYYSDDIGGNSKLFTFFESLNYTHLSPNYYSNVELAKIKGSLDFSDSGVINFDSRGYYVLNYLTNVVELLNTSSIFTGKLDISNLPNIEKVEWNTCTDFISNGNSKLTSLSISNPSGTVQIINLPNITPTISLNDNVTSVEYRDWEGTNLFDTLFKGLSKKTSTSKTITITTNTENKETINRSSDWDLTFISNLINNNSATKTNMIDGTIHFNFNVREADIDRLECSTYLVITYNNLYISFHDENAEKECMVYSSDGYGVLKTDLTNKYYANGDYYESIINFPELQYFKGVSGISENYAEGLKSDNIRSLILPNISYTFYQGVLSTVGNSTLEYFDMGSTSSCQRYQGDARVQYLIQRNESDIVTWYDYKDSVTSPTILKSGGYVFVPETLAYKYKTNTNYSSLHIVKLPLDETDIYELWYNENVLKIDNKFAEYITNNIYDVSN